ncbi:MAG: serine/threonine protein kinase [Deltaproteobacteria bacterium]|nr:serine/threonine protein kinase [Deltaproteobacteria bacterium]
MVEVGQVISSKYKLLRLLGDGGMGSVYEAEHLRLGTRVAIKVLHAELARRSGLVERFLQEARVSAQIRSPHVVHVTDVESTPEGVAYLVMELLQGEPLSNVERRERTLSVGTACEYASQILRALEAAHALGVIHRDLKPDNVFVTFEGGRPVLKLIDFGIAKLKQDTPGAQKNLTVAGMLMGTPEYMAPEQAYSADKVDVRADLYAVGVMLYEMLAGTTPATGADPRVVVAKVERGDITPLITAAPNVPREVAGLVHRAMAPRPEMRFASATEMRLALEGAASGKKPPTGLMPAMGGASVVPAYQGSVAPYQGSVAPFQGSVVPAPAASGPELGTGTVMGAPAEGALAAPVVGGSGPPPALGERPGTGTVRAAPLHTRDLQQAPATAYPHAAHPQGGPDPRAHTPAYHGPTGHDDHRPRKGGAGLVVALAVVALLLGAGAVVTYVMSTTPATPAPPDPFSPGTVQTLTTPATTTATPPPTTPTVTPPVTPLQPGPQPQPQPQPGPQPRPDGGAPPKTDAGTAPSNGVPPFPPFPSGFPSAFPSAIPLPSTFPSAFPLPSGFPPLFPPAPPPQKDAPTPPAPGR